MLWVKGGIVTVFSKKTALESENQLGADGIARSPAQPASIRYRRTVMDRKVIKPIGSLSDPFAVCFKIWF
jgi:hypothetical protein